jgi:hypothetical protein
MPSRSWFERCRNAARRWRGAWIIALVAGVGMVCCDVDVATAAASPFDLPLLAQAARTGSGAPTSTVPAETRGHTIDIFILLILVGLAMGAVCRNSRRT